MPCLRGALSFFIKLYSSNEYNLLDYSNMSLQKKYKKHFMTSMKPVIFQKKYLIDFFKIRNKITYYERRKIWKY